MRASVPVRFLFVCTANQNRSPMAAAICEHHLRAVHVSADRTAQQDEGGAGTAGIAHSAGLLTSGAPAADNAVRALAELGIDLSGHRARTLTSDLVATADLVLGMERQHLRAAAVTVPGAFDRCFTLIDFLRRALSTGPRLPGRPLPDWLDEVGAGRRPEEFLQDTPSDAVADPQGARLPTYRQTAREIDALVRGVLSLTLARTPLPLIPSRPPG